MLDRYRNCLTDLFARVRELELDRVGKRLLALEIQEELLARICRAESKIRKSRTENMNIKYRLSQTGGNRESSIKLKDAHQRGIEYIENLKYLILTFRSIGDAIAFIYGDKYELRQLIRSEKAGFITGKKGTRLERAILRASFKWGATVVMNDLTNTLCHGDITIFNPDLWPDGNSPFMLIEAKSGRGGNRQRAERQQQAVKDIMNYIQTDQRETTEGRQIRVAAKEESKHHFDTVTCLLANFPAEGWSSVEAEPGLQYVAIGLNAAASIPQAFEFLNDGNRERLVIGVNAFKRTPLGYYPFPLCIHDPKSLFRFYNGEFVINVVVDITYVNEVLAEYKIKIEPADDAWKIVSLEANENWGERYVMPRAIGQLAAEFLSLRWFIDNVLLENNAAMGSFFQQGVTT